MSFFNFISFINLKVQNNYIKRRFFLSLNNIFNKSNYILGKEVLILEKKLSIFSKFKFCASCANGTDAIILLLKSYGCKSGDVIFVPSFTFISTASSVANLGAVPFFVDVLPDSFNIDPESLEIAINDAIMSNYKIKGVISVDIFGFPSNYIDIKIISEKYNIFFIVDCAQGFGSKFNNLDISFFVNSISVSFYPSKPFGCYGDGGAIFTNDYNVYKKILSYRDHGFDIVKYNSKLLGMNSRLDTIQAAVLIEKLLLLSIEIVFRQIFSYRYSKFIFTNEIKKPVIKENLIQIFAQYTLIIKNRLNFIEKCKEIGIPIFIYYPSILSKQEIFKDCPIVSSGINISLKLTSVVISLPICSYLNLKIQDFIVDFINEYFLF